MYIRPRVCTLRRRENIIIGKCCTLRRHQRQGIYKRHCRRTVLRAQFRSHRCGGGVGDHGCEYMTGGRVVVLGPTGKNFAAGMSGGIAYVLDEDRSLYKRLNKELVAFEEVTNKYDVLELKGLIQEHVAYTNSEKGKRILDNFSEYLPKFKKILPHDYRRMMNAIVQMEEKGLNSEQAQIEAFYANLRA